MLFTVKPVAPFADRREFIQQRRLGVQRVGRKAVEGLAQKGRLQRLLGEIGEHGLAHAGTIGRADLARLREHFDRAGGVSLVDVKHLTLIKLRKVDRFAQLGRQRVQMRAGQRGEAGLRPGRMGQPHQPHPQGIGLAVRIVRQHPLMRQDLQEPIERCLRVG